MGLEGLLAAKKGVSHATPTTTTSHSDGKHGDADPTGDRSRYFCDPNIPLRYAHLQLEKHWYSVGHKQKRKHRKTRGSCGFIELTKMVSCRWKVIDTSDPHVKHRYKRLVNDLELQAKMKARIQAMDEAAMRE